MLRHWIDQLEERDSDLAEVRRIWNKRAEEFSRIRSSESDITFPFIEKRMSLEGKSVIDIGFGAGRYLVPLAQKGMHIHGVEIAENMREFAIQKLNEAQVSYQKENLLNASWEDIDLKEKNWENKFDLVFLSMSPAISSYKELKKVLQASKEGVFISSHMKRSDSLLEELKEELGIQTQEGYIGKLVPIFNILFEEGFFPDLKFISGKREQEVRSEHIIERYSHWLFGASYTEEEKNIVWNCLKKREKDGKLRLKMEEVNGYLFVSTNKK